MLPSWIILFVSLLTVTIFATESEPITHYHGYKVFRTTPRTPDQLLALSDLRQDPDYDFWTEPHQNANVDIMVPPSKLDAAVNFFKEHNIHYEVLIDDVESLVAGERQTIKLHQTKQAGMDWDSYHSYEEIIEWADSLRSLCPTLISAETFGNSTEGRALRVYKISTGGSLTKPAIWVDGTFHAREWISPATVTYLLNDLCRNASNADFLNAVDFYIAPFINPDGYEYSRRVTRMWRKTRSDHGSITGCRGVDPNRNFAFQFGGPGTSDDKCSDNYKGPAAWSEPEAAALRDYLLNASINWQVYITVHSYGQYILIPYSYAEDEYPIDYPDMLRLANESANAMTDVHGTQFTVGQSAETLGPTAGCADDWAYEVAGIKYAYTYELRDLGRYGFILPPVFIIPTAEETLEAMKYTARTFII